MSSLKIILIIIIFFCITPIFSQDYLIDKQRLTPNDGLANLHTSSVFQDKKGFVWVSTKYGLNRYDGYSFKLYTKESHDLYFNEQVKQIKQGDGDNLWLFYKHTKDGKYVKDGVHHIDVFDTKNEIIHNFETYFNEKLPFKISDVLLIKIDDANKRQWIATKQGELFLYQNENFTKVIHLKDALIRTVTINKNNNIYIGCNKEVVHIDEHKNIKNKYQFEQEIGDVWVDDNEKLWVQTNKNKHSKSQTIRLWSKRKNEPAELFYSFERGRFTINGQTKMIHRTEHGDWLIFEPNAIRLMDENGVLIHDMTDFVRNLYEIEPQGIFEANGIIWMTESSGLFKMSLRTKHFNLIHKHDFLSDCRGITEDEKGNIYFNSKDIYQYNTFSKKVTIVKENDATYLLHYYKNTLFSGSYSSLYFSSQHDLTTKTDLYLPTKGKKEFPFSILKTTKKDEFLIGTNNGLFYINRKKNVVSNFDHYNEFEVLKAASINSIHKKNDQIWLATNIGIFLMTEEKGIIKHFSKASGDLPFEDIRHLHIDKNNIFWLASVGGGLIHWQPSIQKGQLSESKQFTINDGLSHNYLYAVYEDDYNNLWIPSDNGLMAFDKETNQVRTFTTEEGLPHNEFNFTSHYQAKDGTLYFGGLGGLISFHPKDVINIKKQEMGLQFTDFYVLEDGKEKLTDKTTLLKNNEIPLNPTDRLMEFKFALLDFRDKKNHTYAYKIEGYTTNWTYSSENFIRLSGLPYGKYTLRIKGKSGAENWSKSELALGIKVIKPFYLKWWFIALILIAIVGFVFWINRKRIQNLEVEKEKLELEVKKRTAQIEADKMVIEKQSQGLKALDIAKTKFFSNITHEFRTPLTLILGPAQQLEKQSLSKIAQNHVHSIKNNAYQLLELVNQLLDLSKLEVHKMPIEWVQYDIIGFTKTLVEQLEPLAVTKSQRIDFQSNYSEWTTSFDKDKWQKIVFNLLSNAIKFTPDSGQITVILNKEKANDKSSIVLNVTDTGIGITAEKQPYIFDRFHQIDNSDTRVQQGTGIGLALVKELVELQNGQVIVESKVNIGTMFTITLPTPSDVQSNQAIPTSFTILPSTLPLEIKEVSPIFNDKNTLRLLIIEDNEGIRSYVKSCLSEHQFEIIEAENGQVGIEKAIEFVPDLIISDVMMPIKDGFEVTKTVRQNPITSHIPIILLTAKSALESRLEGIKKGADVYLTKPFSAEELVLRILKLIELRQLLQQRYGIIGKEVNITESTESETFEVEDKFIKEFRIHILGNLDNGNLDGESLAHSFAMSRMQLHRKIKALTDKSTSEYVRILRLETALFLLKQKELNVNEIAYQTGFSSPSHFSQVFKKHYKKRPSEI